MDLNSFVLLKSEFFSFHLSFGKYIKFKVAQDNGLQKVRTRRRRPSIAYNIYVFAKTYQFSKINK